MMNNKLIINEYKFMISFKRTIKNILYICIYIYMYIYIYGYIYIYMKLGEVFARILESFWIVSAVQEFFSIGVGPSCSLLVLLFS